jgi:hypothetical protein
MDRSKPPGQISIRRVCTDLYKQRKQHDDTVRFHPFAGVRYASCIYVLSMTIHSDIRKFCKASSIYQLFQIL